MSHPEAPDAGPPLAQRAIQSRCVHPAGKGEPFGPEGLDRSIIDHFERQARRHATRLAVKSGNDVLTYAALDALANRIGRAILHGAPDGDRPVGLLLGQGALAVAAVLGVLKAGRIYVPLDPSYPRSRLDAVLEESGAGLILADRATRPLAAALTSDTCPLLDTDALPADVPAGAPARPIGPDSVAAIFYTSGSTARPKGVIQTHRNILHRIMIDAETFHLCPDDRLSLLPSPSYSVSLRNLFDALLTGASIHPFSIEEEGLVRLAGWLMEDRITVYFSVPAIFRQLAEGLTGAEDLDALRLICLVGEGATPRDVDFYRRRFARRAILVNSLASAETGIVRQYFIDADTRFEGDIVPAGYAVDGKEVRVVDDTGRPVPAGHAGEIAVQSRYLAPGYWQRPDLTSAAFLPDPDGGDRRIYLTGDLGRLTPDGCLLHLGRKDTRAKIRGLQVELAELEAALAALPAIREATVVSREHADGGSRLVAYLVTAGPGYPAVSTLRRALREKLPDHMIPSAFVVLAALPLTPNGKVDRRALPEPSVSRPHLDTPFVAPATPLETELARIWAEALELEGLGVGDDFLDLGGHSLAAARIASRVLGAFDVELPMASLFAATTVAAMARLISQRQAERSAPSGPPETV